MKLRPLFGLVWGAIGIMTGAAQAAPDFTRDVRPILAAHCFKCHGPDEKTREAGLRLDHGDSAHRKLDSGQTPIVPGHPEHSELWRRIVSDNPDESMPPASANKPLSPAQKEILREWIAAGGEYQAHWAFLPPRAAPLPAVKQSTWPRNPIDQFILAGLEATGLPPNPEADRYTLARRLYLDLIGLPPTPEEADAFVQDQSPEAYERLVDQLLRSPHYGERWARRWLDLARYADTNGYEKDRVRSIWPYRDWVIAALNNDMPFDQFTIEQLAGDLLPNATVEQRIATGFHRNTMLNEEGGIDPLEFRFYALVDRVNTTGTTWLGLTLGCAQCHTHKYDPIPHSDYYRTMAFLNNADEPMLAIPQPDQEARRAEIAAQAAAAEADLANRFPPADTTRWHVVAGTLVSSGAAPIKQLEDGSFLLEGAPLDKDTLTFTCDTTLDRVTAIRVEVLNDPSLPKNGPGRAENGNFVLSEFSAMLGAIPPAAETNKNAPQSAAAPADIPLKIARAAADFEQQSFPVAQALDGQPQTGWGIHGPGNWNVNRAATFFLEQPAGDPQGKRWTIKLDQQFGGAHVIGRLRIQLAQTIPDERPEEVRRAEHRDQRFVAWLQSERSRHVQWTPLTPMQARGSLPLLTVEEGGVVLVSGDQSKRDVYDLRFEGDFTGVTAVRLEVLPDDRLPSGGPGRIDYEGPFGDFFLSEVTATVAGQPQKIAAASHSFASGNNTAASAIDGDPQTGWMINGGQGRRHEAVFQFAQPLPAATALDLQLLFERYYAANLGKFRVWITKDARPAVARDLLPEVEPLLGVPEEQLSAEQRAALLHQFCLVAPELQAERQKIAGIRAQTPNPPTTLVFAERPANNPRATFVHKRGEFLQPTEQVEPQVLSLFAPLPEGARRDRLTFARWLVSRDNPLVARVTVNRQWQAFFGQGIVRTTEDFGYTGRSPSHPELLDWLAVQFMDQGWSLKQLHKLIVMSATYRQSAAITPEGARLDPQNDRLGRFPRVRLEAELIRDAALRISGVLSTKIGGPSVFPPQPAQVTSEGAYGALGWNVSSGEDRYRRGLYTFAKRTAPYAMFNAFDGPSGEACVARREISNTPLQALTLLNDGVLIEAAQKLGARYAAIPGNDEERLTALFRRCVVRPPTERERTLLLEFLATQRARLQMGELDAASLIGATEPGDAAQRAEQAVWTLMARGLLNLDEVVTKE